MDRDALFSDGTSDYVIPQEPDEGAPVTIRFRTAKDGADEVRLSSDAGVFVMKKTASEGAFDYYETTCRLGTEIFSYYFEIARAGETLRYDRCGATQDIEVKYPFRIIPGFSTPQWAKGAVIYQIFVDRFYNGDPSNDVVDREYIYIGRPCRGAANWQDLPEETDIHRFYGGDLKGVEDKLDYLKDLGVEAVYFNPLFVSPSNHKYDTQDYDHIDPHFGEIVSDGGDILPKNAADNRYASKYRKRATDKANLEAGDRLFARLVGQMHKRGIRVILDGVFNHCGSFNKWMDAERIYEGQPGYEAGAYVSADSPYRSFFRFKDESDGAWPYNGSYEGWWGFDTLPELNYENSSKLEQYILDIGKKWVSAPYNADGWRLDVASDLGQSAAYNHAFWKKFRRAVKTANPDALIIAEHYGGPEEWLSGDEWDSVMNYSGFMEPVSWFLTGMEKHGDMFRADLLGDAGCFADTMSRFMASMPQPSLETAMNELSNHDHSRFLTRTNHMAGRLAKLGSAAASAGVSAAVMREAVVIQMTWPGAPTVYYGDEAGLCGFTDPDSRRTYPWGREDRLMLKFHREMIRLHKTEEPLRRGSLKMLYIGQDLIAYGRFQEGSQLVVVINNSRQRREAVIPVWQAGVPCEGKMRRLICSYEDGFTTQEDTFIVEGGEVAMNLGPHFAVVMKTAMP